MGHSTLSTGTEPNIRINNHWRHFRVPLTKSAPTEH